jgi:hypothetical protein
VLDGMLWPSIECDVDDIPATTCMEELQGLQFSPSLKEVMIGMYLVDAVDELDYMLYDDVVQDRAEFVLSAILQNPRACL